MLNSVILLFLNIYNTALSLLKKTVTLATLELSIYKWAIVKSYQTKNKELFMRNALNFSETTTNRDLSELISFLNTSSKSSTTPRNLADKFKLELISTTPVKYKSLLISLIINLKNSSILWSNFSMRSFSFGFYHLRALVFILFIDACLTDDEPLWEPVEWSLVQTWILFIFTFAWIAENLIVSRYGSYTGRDKRVWFSWYKTFYLIEIYYAFNYGVATLFVIVPFYFETNYSLSFVFSWWHWFSRVFFFKLVSIFTVMLLISYVFQLSIRWLDWKKGLFMVLLINIFLSYLIYTHFIMLFFGYFTDPVWYQKTRPVDYIQLSHEPSRWGWGPAKKDHFTYHNVKTVFWFKNDGPFASSFLLFHQFFFLSLFALYIYWISLFRRIYSTKEIPLTYSTYCVSALKQFFYAFFLLYAFVLASYIFNYQRFPIEFLWTLDDHSWTTNLVSIIYDYPSLIYSILFN